MSKVSRRHLAEVIGERTLHVTDTTALAREIAAYLLAERRSNDIASLIRDIMEYRNRHGIVEARVTSAHELNDTVRNDIERILKEEFPAAKQLIFRSHITPDVVGGVKVELPNEQLDMTVRRKLDTFKRLTASEKE